MQKSSFLDKYEQISSTDDFKGVFDSSLEKVCKFCSKTSKENTFLNIPHVIPELLGRNNYTSNDECDNCNELFGSFETDLANYISPYQTIIGQRTKKKIPTFQSRRKGNDQSTTIKYSNDVANFNFGNNRSDFKYDYENKELTVSLRKKKFVPINVYKSLVKIGLSLCPKKELENYKNTIDWLSKNDTKDVIYDIPLTLYRTRFINKYYEKPFATLYRRKIESTHNTYEPRLSLVVHSGVLCFQLFIPFSNETTNISSIEYQLINEIYPAFLLDIDFKGKEKIQVKKDQLPIIKFDMNYSKQVEENEVINFQYDNLLSSKRNKN